jgi:hypothetical protein
MTAARFRHAVLLALYLIVDDIHCRRMGIKPLSRDLSASKTFLAKAYQDAMDDDKHHDALEEEDREMSR